MRRVYLLLATCTLLLLYVGCAAPPVKPIGDFIWPLPPEPPRIKWITSWSGEEDFRRPNPILTYFIGEDRGLRLKRPSGVVADSAGNVYAADSERGVIFVFDIEKNTLRFLGEGMLAGPGGLAIDNKRGIIFVTDSKQDTVVGLDKMTGKFVMGIGAPKEFENPSGVTLDEEKERLYVSDSQNHNIKVFDMFGKPLFTIGKRGDGDGEFNFPGHLAFRHGKLYVSDTLNYRIQIFDGDGKFLKKFGKIGDAPGFFSRPKGIGVNSEGHIFVVDAAFNNFQIFDEEGQLLLWVGHTGSDPGSMSLPAGLYIDEKDRIYLSDTFNRRVQVFQYLKEPGKMD